MPRPTGPTNPVIRELVARLRQRREGVWRRAAELLSRPTRRRVEVNLSKINRYGDKGVLLVPGVVLASGTLEKPVTVSALRFSAEARRKITEAGGRALGVEQLLEENPEGKGVIILI